MTRKQQKMIADKMSVPKTKTKTTTKTKRVNQPTKVRAWWLVDVRETRTIKVYAAGPKHARDMAATLIADLYPPESYNGEPNVVKSFAHTVQVDEGRSTSDRR